MKPLPPLLLVVACLATPAGHARAFPDPGQKPAPGNEQPQVPLSQAGYRPEVNYQLQCAGCHLPRGQGAPANDVPNMIGFVGNFLRVPGGREFLVRVPGVAQAALNDEQLAALLNWILRRDGIAGDSTPAGAEPYSADEVAAIRHRMMDNIPGTRAGLVRVMRDQGIDINDGMPATAP
ncbi:cytochrome C [Alloalcanivorax xenomutans]|uniref:cytochrome C n=1 Tax=Alloalcanivorax xenomutans TaxID=1094342 RepID=UPI0029349198|nr:cytochrome C [Alloalcanivorax xenomutans]WOD28950.1 cytochrome C [Alloalcanivorax xenomutans]